MRVAVRMMRTIISICSVSYSDRKFKYEGIPHFPVTA